MSAKALVARIGQVATSGKHKDRFLYVGTIEPKDSLEKFFYLIEIDSPWVNGEKIKNAIINTLGENYQPVSSKDKVDALEEIIKKINLFRSLNLIFLSSSVSGGMCIASKSIFFFSWIARKTLG